MTGGSRAGRGAWVLEIQGRRVELREGETTLGRSRGCGVVVKDPAVSRGHALVWVRGDRVTVQDLRSSNGTYLNGERVEAETPMAEGDRLTVGETQAFLRFARDDGRRPSRIVPAPAPEELASSSTSGDLTSPPGIASPLPWHVPALDRTPPAGPPPTIPAAAPVPALAPAVPVELVPAEFWARAGAFALDAVAVVAGASVLALPLGGPFTPRGRLLAWVLAGLLALFVPLAGWCLWGTTPGKRLLGLTVHGPDGRAGLSVGRALLRLAGYALSALPLGAGFWMALGPERLALHDRLAGTTVLQARPAGGPGRIGVR